MKTRRAEVDLLRAFGIILMVLGHVGLGNQFSHFIHAFHMPMWFIVSGYFVNIDSDVKHYVQKRFKSLIIPYLCWGIPFEIAISSFGTGGGTG